MSELTKQALRVENNQSFPNNNAGLITPSALRTFNEDMIDSTVNQVVYTTDSASFDSRINNITGSATNTGSLLTTASFDNGTRDLTFTKGDSSTFAVNIPGASGSVLPSGVVSGSSQIILQDTTGLLSGSRIDGAVALATNSTYADNTIVYGKNLHSTTIPKGTPLFFTGSGTAGNLVGILPADAGNPLLMPAGGIAGESILVDEEGIVILDGFINEVDTTAFASGDEVFVGVGGGYTNVVPTGSNNLIQFLGYVERSAVNGSGVIQMSGEARSLPNLQSGYAWVGDGNDVPQPIPTSSFGTSIDTGSFATTGSNTFTSQQIINSNDGIILRTNDGTSTGEVRITPGSNPPTKFTPSTLSGIDNIDALKLSGSWGQVGDGAPAVGATSGVGLYNHGTGSTERVTLSTRTYTPFQANNSGAVQIKGNTIGLLSSSSLGTTSVQVSGDITASNISLSNDLIVSKTIESQIYINPQTLSGSLTIPTDKNAMLVGPVSIDGTLVVEGNSNLLVLSQITGSGDVVLPSGLLSSSVTDFTTYSASVDTRINNISFDTSSLATTGSNTFIGNQTITGSLFLSSSVSSSIIVPNAFLADGFVIDGNLKVQNGTLNVLQAINAGGIYLQTIGRNSNDPINVDNGLNIRPGAPGIAATNVSISGSVIVSQSVDIGEVINLTAQDPLPSGNIGDLAVSGSSLYFYNGAWTVIV